MTRKRSFRIFIAASSAIVLPITLIAWTAYAYTGASVANGGSVSGKVTFSGSASSAKLKVTKDNDTCGQTKPVESIILGSGKALQNVVVHLEGVTKGKPLGTSAPVLTQTKCSYAPHVQATTAGSTLEVHNGDPILHNVYAKLDAKRTLFNIGMPVKDQIIKKPLKKAGVVTMTCDAGHTWMSAYILVFDHPYYAVTGKDGTFKLDDVPPGTYKLVAWHEELGTKETSVTVDASGKVTSDFAF